MPVLMTDEQIAHVCYEANRAYCDAINDLVPTRWDDLADDLKQSAIRGVQFTLQNASTPQLQHEAWRTERIAQGWVHGPVLDRAQKIHPNLIDYNDLPPVSGVYESKGGARRMAYELDVSLANPDGSDELASTSSVSK